MADVLTSQQRSFCMSQVPGRNTSPEMLVRRALHRLGFRYRLHRRDLPGTPDIVLPGRGTVIFVHGCFWHGHPACRRAVRPTSNARFWKDKLDGNIRRDHRNRQALEALGWRVQTIWECETRSEELDRHLLQMFRPTSG